MAYTPFFTPSEENVLKDVVIASSSLSVIGTILIILSYALWPDNRSPLRRLLLYLSLADLLTATGNLVGVFRHMNSVICTVQSFIVTYSSMCSFLWTLSIAVYLYLMINRRHLLAIKLTFLFHLVCWGLPLMIVCLATGFNALGEDSFSANVGWCWISNSYLISWPPLSSFIDPQLFWQLIAGKGIEILTYVLTPIIYILSKQELSIQHYDQRLHLNTNVQTTLQDTDRKLVLIPLIFVGMRVWGTVRLFDDRTFWLALFQGFGDSAQGWANCLLYCIFTRKIREKFVRLGLDIVHCNRREQDENVVDNEISG